LVASDSGETVFGAGTTMSDVLGRHTYHADVGWSTRAQPDWHLSYVYDRWRPTLFATYADDTDPLRGGDVRTRELNAGVLLPFRRVRWTETLMAGGDLESDDVTCRTTCAFRDQTRTLRSLRAGWLHDSR